MAVRRKSNWYIYFIAFGIALAFAITAIIAFRWYLFPEESRPVDVDMSGNPTDDFRPTSDYNFAVLTMISEGNNEVPELFVLVEYNAVAGRIAFVPLPAGISMPKEGRTLSNVYAAQGGKKTAQAVEDAVGIPINGFINMDKDAFITVLTYFGNMNYDVPKTVIIEKNNEVTTVNAGEQRITADTFYSLIMYADFGEGESYRFNIIGSMLSELINQNFRNADSALLDTYFRAIAENAETDIEDPLYRKHKPALLYTVEYGSSPAEYYIPYGEFGDDGGFVISENSIITIKQKLDLE